MPETDEIKYGLPAKKIQKGEIMNREELGDKIDYLIQSNPDVDFESYFLAAVRVWYANMIARYNGGDNINTIRQCLLDDIEMWLDEVYGD